VPLDAVDGDDTAEISANNVFFRPDEIVQEDATEIHDRLIRFSTFLKCAIEAGEARRAVEHMKGEAGAEARATLARTVNWVMRPHRQARELPSSQELRTASLTLHLLHQAART
jgi:hypothetical protein